MTDESLLREARDGREGAFTALYERYRDCLFRFGYRLTGSAAQAEDLVHDCFVDLLRAPQRFSAERGSLRGYLYAAVRNLARKRLRDHEREELTADSEAPGPEDDSPLYELLDREMAEQVRDAVAALPFAQREVLVLAEYEELPLAQIAAITGIEVGAVKARLHRARAGLKRTLMQHARTALKRSAHE